MKLALMAGDMIPAEDLRPMGFEAVQTFFGSGQGNQEDSRDPSPDDVDQVLRAGDTALAAMALHIGLVGPQGRIPADVDRAVRCVGKTAELKGRFGANEKPLMIWHPSQYPANPGVDDHAVFEGLTDAPDA